MAENTTINQTLEAWAEIVIDNWEQKIHALNISYSYALVESFVHHIISESGGDATRIEFAFNYYGKFVDMGVGKGVPLSATNSQNTRRRPRKWYSKTFYSEVKKLGAIVAKKYAQRGALMIVENLADNADRGIGQTLN